MLQIPPFDKDDYKAFNDARSAFLDRFLAAWKMEFAMETAADIGCGFGFFSSYLAVKGFRVTAIDGREENVNEARRRHPEVVFQQLDAEDQELARLGTYDFVLCFGLLYHLENPFRTIRSLRTLTRHMLLLEGMCIPGRRPVMELLDEGPSDDQGLNHVAFYPSEACLIKMLYRAGFQYVYTFLEPPGHKFYHSSFKQHRYRTILLASGSPMRHPELRFANEQGAPDYPWHRSFSRAKWGIRLRLSKVKRALFPVKHH
jgi:SAM-dependent methyltransferase